MTHPNLFQLFPHPAHVPHQPIPLGANRFVRRAQTLATVGQCLAKHPQANFQPLAMAFTILQVALELIYLVEGGVELTVDVVEILLESQYLELVRARTRESA